MKDHVKKFSELHQQPEPFLLGNVWNVQSAKVLEQLNAKAIGTSSAAVAETLGYSDGEQMPFNEYLLIIKRIKASTTTPFTVDLEAGYGKTEEAIVENIKQLAALGIVGINLEDSVVDNSVRAIENTEHFAGKLKRITDSLRRQQIDIFINVRCDAFLLNVPDARREAINRIAAYETAGADGIFLPCITHVEDIKATVNSTTLPVNVMCMPSLPDFNTLSTSGVKRISMGPFANMAAYKKMHELCEHVIKENSFAPLF